MTFNRPIEPAAWSLQIPAEVIAACGLERRAPPFALVRERQDKPTTGRVARGPMKLMLRTLGAAAAGVGFVGAFVPLLPTTPFLLIASWAFLRSSPALAQRLHEHPLLGPYLREWAARRAIPRSVKVMGVASIGASLAGVYHLADPGLASVLGGWALIAAAGYVGTRPSC